MRRSLLAAAVVAAASFSASCDAHLTESCIGVCSLTTGSGGMTGTGGMGGAGGGPDAANCPSTPQTGDFPCDVFAVIHQNCNPCHQMPPKNGAPFPLLTYADTQNVFTPGVLVFQQMFISTGPNGSPRMPFGGMLTPTDYATLHAWLGECAPPVAAGTGCGCPGNGCN